jgi:hypothetical protein
LLDTAGRFVRIEPSRIPVALTVMCKVKLQPTGDGSLKLKPIYNELRGPARPPDYAMNI